MFRTTLLLTLTARISAQSDSSGCNSACINYLTALTNEKNIENAAVWDYSGPVTAQQVNSVCTLADPLSCCNCGGTGLNGADEELMLARWAIICNTFNTVQDGGQSAVTCWTSDFHQGCVDYNNVEESSSCAAGSDSTGNSSSAGSGNSASSSIIIASSSAATTLSDTSATESSTSASQTGTSAASNTPSEAAPDQLSLRLASAISLGIVAMSLLLAFQLD